MHIMAAFVVNSSGSSWRQRVAPGKASDMRSYEEMDLNEDIFTHLLVCHTNM